MSEKPRTLGKEKKTLSLSRTTTSRGLEFFFPTRCGCIYSCEKRCKLLWPHTHASLRIFKTYPLNSLRRRPSTFKRHSWRDGGERDQFMVWRSCEKVFFYTTESLVSVNSQNGEKNSFVSFYTHKKTFTKTVFFLPICYSVCT